MTGLPAVSVNDSPSCKATGLFATIMPQTAELAYNLHAIIIRDLSVSGSAIACKLLCLPNMGCARCFCLLQSQSEPPM